ncbi:hypothetical protein [Thioalkalivibrio sp. ALE23]|uniref:hypothetical protein n=1 Tax=Thioalkalivibrio sp. ALE23 TaxID=1265495 RepID=UPI00038243F0|nr:hypothetical protein [Thioalkalivibrio sp. ALE23]
MENRIIEELRTDAELRETFAEQDPKVWAHQADMLGLVDLEEFIASEEAMTQQIRQLLLNHGEI